jgi:pyridoxine 5-phosphate synthase
MAKKRANQKAPKKSSPKAPPKADGPAVDTGNAYLLPRLGVNIDHIATLRQLRNTPYPSITEAARMVERAGGTQITVHLREDRRHIQDADVFALKKMLRIDLNLEMSMAPAIVKIAHKVNPTWVCIVPEKRQEVTTEGGLDVKKYKNNLKKMIAGFKKKKIKVSLFVEPDLKVIELSHELGADAVELHTGRYCNAAQKAFGAKSNAVEKSEFKRIEAAAKLGKRLGIHVHAGHGFDEINVRPVAALNLIEEYNIGHSVVCRAAMVGLEQAVREMVAAIQAP